jgi:ATP-dependent helicase IRC3
MRLSPITGKQDCHVIDFVDSTNRIVGIANAPTLFGLAPEAVIDGALHSFTLLLQILTLDSGASVQELEARADAANGELRTGFSNPTGDNLPSVPEPKSVTYIDYDSPFALVNQSTGASPHIAQLSRNAWVDCGEGIHVLECLGKGHIRIEPVSDGEHNRRTSFSG